MAELKYTSNRIVTRDQWYEVRDWCRNYFNTRQDNWWIETKQPRLTQNGVSYSIVAYFAKKEDKFMFDLIC